MRVNSEIGKVLAPKRPFQDRYLLYTQSVETISVRWSRGTNGMANRMMMKMNVKKNSLLGCVAVVLVVMLSTVAWSIPDPTEQLRPYIDKITDIISASSEKELKDPALVDKVMEVAHKGFDFQEMSKRVLGRQWKKLSPADQEHFIGLFTQLLQHAYVSQIKDYSGQKISFVKHRIKGRRAEVQTLIIDRERKVAVSYIMLLKDDQWKAYDIVVEGVSLVRNYLEQFRTVIRQDGYAELTKKLEQRIQHLQENPLVGKG